MPLSRSKRWVVVTESDGTWGSKKLQAIQATVVEADTAREAANEAVRMSSVAACRKGVTVSVFKVGVEALRVFAQYENPDGHLFRNGPRGPLGDLKTEVVG